MAEEIKKPEINPGKPVFTQVVDTNKSTINLLSFNGALHPGQIDADKKSSEALSRLHSKLSGTPDYEAHLAKKTFAKGEEAKEFSGIAQKHAAEEFKTYEAAKLEADKVRAELRKAQSDLLKGKDFDITKIEGYSKEAESDIRKAIDAVHKEADELSRQASQASGFVGRIFPKVSEHGVGGTLAENLGLKALKEAKVKTGFRYAGVAAGALLVGRGLLKGKTQDENGVEVNRGIGVRALETVGGVGLAAISGLAGGR